MTHYQKLLKNKERENRYEAVRKYYFNILNDPSYTHVYIDEGAHASFIVNWGTEHRVYPKKNTYHTVGESNYRYGAMGFLNRILTTLGIPLPEIEYKMQHKSSNITYKVIAKDSEDAKKKVKKKFGVPKSKLRVKTKIIKF